MNSADAYRYNQTAQPGQTTRWADDEEIRSGLTPIWLFDERYSACGLPLISDGRTAYVDDSDSHTLVMGSTGSKKTRLFAMPMMNIIAKAGESVICTDPKGELYERTSGLFAREGYRVLVVNLRDPERSNGWNPLLLAQELYRQGERERATILVNDLAATLYPDKGSRQDPFWQQMAITVFQGLCGLMVENGQLFSREYCNFLTLRALASQLKENSGLTAEEVGILACSPNNAASGKLGATNKLAWLYPDQSTAKNHLDAVTTAAGRTFDSIMATYHASVQTLYVQESLVRMLSVPEIDFSTLGDRKTALYLIMPDEKTTLHSIVSLIIKQCYESLISAAQRHESRALPVRVNFLLDEFSNLPAIPDMNAMISAARSRNIRFFLIIQSMHQLTGKYGDDAYTIRGNCNNWVYLTSRELMLLEELERLCGTDSRTGNPLISISQLQRLDKETGEALVLSNRHYPYISHLADIDDYPFADLPPRPLPELPRAERAVSVPDLDELHRYLLALIENAKPLTGWKGFKDVE